MRFIANVMGAACLAAVCAGGMATVQAAEMGMPRTVGHPGMASMPGMAKVAGAPEKARGGEGSGTGRAQAEGVGTVRSPNAGVDKTYIGPALPVAVSEQAAEDSHGVANMAAAAKANTRRTSPESGRVPVPLDLGFQGALYKVQARSRAYEVQGVGVTELDQDLLFDTDVTQSGLVRALYVFPGEIIQRNQPIMSIFSPERVNVQHMFLADFSKDAGNQLSLQYYSSFGSAQSFLDGARANMRWWGFTDAQMKKLLDTGKIVDDYVVSADNAGYVIQTLQSPGGLVVAGDRGSQSFVLAGETVLHQARLNVLWGMVFVKPGDFHRFQIGQKVDVTVGEGRSQWETTGTVVHKHGYVTEEARRADFHVMLENPQHAFRPGTFIRLRQPVSDSGLWVPVSAVLYLPTGASVIRKDAGSFTLVPVDLGARAGDEVEIAAGLKAGDDIVASPRSELDPDARTVALYGWH